LLTRGLLTLYALPLLFTFWRFRAKLRGMLRGIFRTKNLDDILAAAQEKGDKKDPPGYI